MPELDLDVAVGGDLAHRRLVVVAVLLPQRLALLADLRAQISSQRVRMDIISKLFIIVII